MPVTSTATGARVALRVVPRSPRTVVDGIRDGRIVVRVTAPPVDGAANDAVVAALATALRLPKRAIRIVSGDTARNKTADVTGLDAAEIRARLLT